MSRPCHKGWRVKLAHDLANVRVSFGTISVTHRTYEALLDPFHIARPCDFFLASRLRCIIRHDDIVEIGSRATTEIGSCRRCFSAAGSRIGHGHVLGAHRSADRGDDVLQIQMSYCETTDNSSRIRTLTSGMIKNDRFTKGRRTTPSASIFLIRRSGPWP